jgi:putative membrane protein
MVDLEKEGVDMMWWYGNGMGGWVFALMLASNVLFWGLIVFGVVALVRYRARGDRVAGPRLTPEELLAERFARGEIDEQEYNRRLDTLTQRPRVEP